MTAEKADSCEPEDNEGTRSRDSKALSGGGRDCSCLSAGGRAVTGRRPLTLDIDRLSWEEEQEQEDLENILKSRSISL